MVSEFTLNIRVNLFTQEKVDSVTLVANIVHQIPALSPVLLFIRLIWEIFCSEILFIPYVEIKIRR